MDFNDADYFLDIGQMTFEKAEAVSIDHFRQLDFWKSMSFRSTSDNSKNLYFYKASNIDIAGNQDKPAISISGNSYIIEWKRPFFHLMHDIVGEFLLIKESVPDLKPVIIYTGKMKSAHEAIKAFCKVFSRTTDFIEQLLDLIGFNYEDFIFLAPDGNLKIENLYTISLYGDGIRTDIFQKIDSETPGNLIDKGNDASYAYRFAVTLAMKNFFAGKRQNKPVHRKIFVSVKHKRDIVDRSKMLYDFLTSNGVTWSVDWRNAENTEKVDGLDLSAFYPAQFNSGVKDVHLRYISDEEEMAIESFFEEQGFEVLTFDGMSLKDQMDIMSESKIVVVWAGASQLQSLFVQEECTFVYIAPKMSYVFPHEDILEVIKPDAKILFDKRKYENYEKTFDSDTIIKAVKKVLRETA